MTSQHTYRNMTVSQGVAQVERHFTSTDLANVTRFSDLHEICDANMTLPYHEDCNNDSWMAFANAVIETFDRKYQTSESPS